jgi:hypothetical protein
LYLITLVGGTIYPDSKPDYLCKLGLHFLYLVIKFGGSVGTPLPPGWSYLPCNNGSFETHIVSVKSRTFIEISDIYRQPVRSLKSFVSVSNSSISSLFFRFLKVRQLSTTQAFIEKSRIFCQASFRPQTSDSHVHFLIGHLHLIIGQLSITQTFIGNSFVVFNALFWSQTTDFSIHFPICHLCRLLVTKQHTLGHLCFLF